MEKFTFKSFLLRLAAALALVFLTFNPSGFSYAHWVAQVMPKVNAVQAVAGVFLLIGWIVFVVATLRSIGLLGIALVAILFAALTWLMVSMGWLTLRGSHAMGWIALLALAVALAVGMSWSFVNRRISGQITDDDKADSV